MEKLKKWLIESTKNKIIFYSCLIAIVAVLAILIICVFFSKSNDKEVKQISKTPVKTEAPKESKEPIVSTTPEAVHVHNVVYVSNNDGTHKLCCENTDGLECDYVETNENCVYDDENDVCINCGYQNVVEEIENTPEPSEETKNQNSNYSSSNQVNNNNIGNCETR